MLLEKICKELGVEIGEEWIGIGELHKPIKCKIKNNTLWIYHKYAFEEDDKYSWKEAGTAVYKALIKGYLKPVWKPKKGETYYTPRLNHHKKERFITRVWTETEADYFYLNNNMAFKTKEECNKKSQEIIDRLGVIK